MLAWILVLFGLAMAQESRPSPEFEIALPDGHKLALSQYRGKVVALEFLFTTCPHCQTSSRFFSRMQAQYGSKGLQCLGVAFNPMAVLLVPDFVKDHQVGFPVGFSIPETVHQYLNVPPNYRLMVPQFVLIDRKGVIRAQTPAAGSSELHEEKNIQAWIEKLLSEPATAPAPAPSTSKKK
jgi:peroxiredoxin